MTKFTFITSIALVAALAVSPFAAADPPSAPEVPIAPAAVVAPRKAQLEEKSWTINDEKRIALIAVPASATELPTPIVFAFHGHGGSARQASRSFHMHTDWPDAIVVYMEGLPTPGALTDREGKRNGWQMREGVQDDRDLKFFDAVLASLKSEYKVDEQRIYAMGHSNGGGFTFLLWQTRPDVFAAFAPSGAYTLRARSLEPKPVLHIAGKNDQLVKFDRQEDTIQQLRKNNHCADMGEPWSQECTIYASASDNPVVTYIYDGGHTYPTDNAPALIVKFFKQHAKPAAKVAEHSDKPKAE